MTGFQIGYIILGILILLGGLYEGISAIIRTKQK